MTRDIESDITKDLKKKMVLLTGPRQVGKTYLSRQIGMRYEKPQYLNYDNESDYSIINKSSWAFDTDLLILDEIHKKKNWKVYLKGTFDKKPESQSILVTGSVRMDTFRQSGESLAGRYFRYRLGPLSVKELSGTSAPYETVAALITLGGFPEPFLSGSEDEANRWRKQYHVDLVREDILEFSRINEIATMRLLVEMLRNRVGAPLSYRSLANDLQLAPNTVHRYVDILAALYIIFLVRPYHRNIARAIQREPKLYFYDSGYVQGNAGIRLENTVALCLLKHVQYLQDARGKDIDLAYLRTKEKKEVDFVLVEDGRVKEIIEVKLSKSTPSRDLIHFKRQLPEVRAVQLVHNLAEPEYHKDADIHITRAGEYLACLEA